MKKPTPSRSRNVSKTRSKYCPLFASKYPKRTPEDLIVSFIPLVKKMAAAQPELQHELESAGYVGLMVAAKKYDHRRGTAFDKYARPWIIKYMMDCRSFHYHPVRIPANQILKMCQKKKDMMFDSEEQYKYFSLDCNEPRGDVLKDIQEELDNKQRCDDLPHQSVVEHELKEIVKNTMKKYLNRKERTLLKKRMGLDGHEPHTLEELGKEYGITREAIRMNVNRAIEKLKPKFHEAYEEPDGGNKL